MIGQKKNGIRACSRICRGDRARLNAREGSGALHAGRAGKMAARWHEIVEAQKRARVVRADGRRATRIAGGREREQKAIPTDRLGQGISPVARRCGLLPVKCTLLIARTADLT